MVLTGSFDQRGGMWFNPGFFAQLDTREQLPASAPSGPGPPSRPEIPALLGEWPAALIADEIEAGRLRVLIVLGGNPVTALPDSARVLAALDQLDALVVLETMHTQTVDLASHVIACPDQLERADLPTLDLFSSAVSTHYTPPVVSRPHGLVSMWRSIAEIGQVLGVELLGDGVDLDDVGDDDVLARVARGGDFERLRAAQSAVVARNEVYAWAEARLPHGRWDVAPAPLVEQLAGLPTTSDGAPPLVVTPRRQPRHMNGQHFRVGDEPTALLHPADSAAHDISDGDLIDVISESGTLQLRAVVTDAIARGSVSVPHGWGDTNVNRMISSRELDPLTGMPRLSGTPVTIRPSERS
jgi:anaerobic selenocysteine-containing dehydrogenase